PLKSTLFRTTKLGVTLHGAVERGEEQLVLQLLRLGVSPYQRDDRGVTPLHLAASRGHEAILMFMLSQQASLDAAD
ncbi:unnamed protein product, partial [Hapterophycus canaliculatus]